MAALLLNQKANHCLLHLHKCQLQSKFTPTGYHDSTLSLVELLNEETDNNYSPPMPNIPETDSMNLTTPSSNSDSELRNFFGALLTDSRPSKNGSATKKQLTGIGESLTSEEAMKRLLEEEGAKKKKKR